MRIGFIGLGNMGGPMALNVMKAGHAMVVNDIRQEMAAPHLRQGATWADTPKAVAEQSELIFTSLPGPGKSRPWLWGKMEFWRERHQEVSMPICQRARPP